MSEQNNIVKKEATSIIEAFLATHPNPSVQQWKELTLSHPQYAAEISETFLMFDDACDDNEVEFDSSLFDATRSVMLSAVYKNTDAVTEVKKALKQCRGPAARNFAFQIGLGERVDLFNQMVSGEVSAPFVLLKRLAARLHVQVAALAEVFSLNFQFQQAQAFKANGKPSVNLHPVSWETAVKETGVSGDEATRLLHIDMEID